MIICFNFWGFKYNLWRIVWPWELFNVKLNICDVWLWRCAPLKHRRLLLKWDFLNPPYCTQCHVCTDVCICMHTGLWSFCWNKDYISEVISKMWGHTNNFRGNAWFVLKIFANMIVGGSCTDVPSGCLDYFAGGFHKKIR